MKKGFATLTPVICLIMLSGFSLFSKNKAQGTVVLEKAAQESTNSEWRYALRFTGKGWSSGVHQWIPKRVNTSNTIFLNRISGTVKCENIKIANNTFRNNQFCQGGIEFVDGRVLVDLQFNHEDKISIMRRFSDAGPENTTYRSVGGNPAVFGDTRLHVFNGYIKELWSEYRVVDRHRMMSDSVEFHYKRLKKLGLHKDEPFIVYNKAINDKSLSIEQIEHKWNVRVIYRGTLGDFATGFKLKKLLPNLWSHDSVSARLPKHPKLLINIENNSGVFDFNGEYNINLTSH